MDWKKSCTTIICLIGEEKGLFCHVTFNWWIKLQTDSREDWSCFVSLTIVPSWCAGILVRLGGWLCGRADKRRTPAAWWRPQTGCCKWCHCKRHGAHARLENTEQHQEGDGRMTGQGFDVEAWEMRWREGRCALMTKQPLSVATVWTGSDTVEEIIHRDTLKCLCLSATDSIADRR